MTKMTVAEIMEMIENECLIEYVLESVNKCDDDIECEQFDYAFDYVDNGYDEVYDRFVTYIVDEYTQMICDYLGIEYMEDLNKALRDNYSYIFGSYTFDSMYDRAINLED